MMVLLFVSLWMGILGAMEQKNENNTDHAQVMTAIIEYKEHDNVVQVEHYDILPRECQLYNAMLGCSLRHDEGNTGIYDYAQKLQQKNPFFVAVEMYGIPREKAEDTVRVFEQASWNTYRKLGRTQTVFFENEKVLEGNPLQVLSSGFVLVYPSSGDSLKIALKTSQGVHDEFFIVQPYLSTDASKKHKVRRFGVTQIDRESGHLTAVIKCNFVRNFHVKTDRAEPKEPLLDYILRRKN